MAIGRTRVYVRCISQVSTRKGIKITTQHRKKMFCKNCKLRKMFFQSET